MSDEVLTQRRRYINDTDAVYTRPEPGGVLNLGRRLFLRISGTFTDLFQGYTNSSLYTGSIEYIDIPNEPSYWYIPLTCAFSSQTCIRSYMTPFSVDGARGIHSARKQCTGSNRYEIPSHCRPCNCSRGYLCTNTRIAPFCGWFGWVLRIPYVTKTHVGVSTEPFLSLFYDSQCHFFIWWSHMGDGTC